MNFQELQTNDAKEMFRNEKLFIMINIHVNIATLFNLIKIRAI